MKPIVEQPLEDDHTSFTAFIVITVVIGLGLMIAESTDSLPNEALGWILPMAGIFGIFFLASSLRRVKSIIIFDDHFILESKNRFNAKRQVFNYSEIENLNVIFRMKSDSYISAGHVRVLGMDMTPESMKTYYRHPEVLTFLYKVHTIEIGKWKKAFDAEEIVTLIRKLKSRES